MLSEINFEHESHESDESTYINAMTFSLLLISTIKFDIDYTFGWGGRIRTAEMPESKSGALPLGYSPILN